MYKLRKCYDDDENGGPKCSGHADAPALKTIPYTDTESDAISRKGDVIGGPLNSPVIHAGTAQALSDEIKFRRLPDRQLGLFTRRTRSTTSMEVKDTYFSNPSHPSLRGSMRPAVFEYENRNGKGLRYERTGGRTFRSKTENLEELLKRKDRYSVGSEIPHDVSSVVGLNMERIVEDISEEHDHEKLSCAVSFGQEPTPPIEFEMKKRTMAVMTCKLENTPVAESTKSTSSDHSVFGITKLMQSSTTKSRQSIRTDIPFPSEARMTWQNAHKGIIYALSGSRDGAFVFSGGSDGDINAYDCRESAFQYNTIKSNSAAVTALAVEQEECSTEMLIYAGSSDGSVRGLKGRCASKSKEWTKVVDLPPQRKAVRRLLTIGTLGGSVQLGGMLLTCSMDGTIRLFDVEPRQILFTVTTFSGVLDIAEFGESRRGVMLSGHVDGQLRVWSSLTGRPLSKGVKVHKKGITSVSCLTDGNSVVSLGRDNAIRMSDIRMSSSTIRDMHGGVQCVSDWHRIAAYGRNVVCGLPGRELRIWNVDNGRIIQRIHSRVPSCNFNLFSVFRSKLRYLGPRSVTVPLWTSSDYLFAAHSTETVSFWP